MDLRIRNRTERYNVIPDHYNEYQYKRLTENTLTIVVHDHILHISIYSCIDQRSVITVRVIDKSTCVIDLGNNKVFLQKRAAAVVKQCLTDGNLINSNKY